MQASNTTNQQSAARRQRTLLLSGLIVAVTFFWMLILMYTNLPTMALAGIGVLSLIVLAVGTAWTAMAYPGRTKS